INEALSGSNLCNCCTDNASSTLAQNREAAGNQGVWCDYSNGAREFYYINEHGSSYLSGNGVRTHATWAEQTCGSLSSSCINRTITGGSATGTGNEPPGSGGSPPPGDDAPHSCCQCQAPIQKNHQRIRTHVTNEFENYRHWFVNDYFKQHILPAWQLMTSQLTAVAMQQVFAIGQFFDAKHQLESQRLIQVLTAQAHKDYQPSEGMCIFGTNMRSLAASERKSDLTLKTLAARTMQRQLATGDVLTKNGAASDKESRIKSFIKNHCDI
ncbi:MAG: hypothetical protein CUN55_16490, partial [Phototrophicales bacterium]